VLRRPASRGEDRGPDGEVEVLEDLADDGGISEEGDDAHLPMARGTAERVDLVDPGEELSPAGAGSGGRGGAIRGVRARVGPGYGEG